MSARMAYAMASLMASLACSGCSPAPTVASPEPSKASPKASGPTLAWHDPALRSHGDYSEMVIIRGVMADGGSLYGRLRITNVGPADGDAELRLGLSPAGGPSVSVKRARDGGDWTAGPGLAVDLGGATLGATGDGISATASSDRTRIELTITSSLPPLRPLGGGPGDGIDGITLPVPHGAFSATVTADGATRRFTGAAWVEHWVSTTLPHRRMKAQHTVLDLRPDGVISAWGAQPVDGGPARGWLLVIGDGAVQAHDPAARFTPLDVRADGETGYGVPHGLRVEGAGRVLTLRQGAPPRRKDDLSGLNAFQRLVVERLTQPWSFRFDEAPYTVAPGGSGRARYIYQQLNR